VAETAVVRNFVEKENIQPFVRNSRGARKELPGTSTADPTRRRAARLVRVVVQTGR
jgi:hypothetical protein